MRQTRIASRAESALDRTKELATVPCRKVCKLVNVAWPYWLSASVLIGLQPLEPCSDIELMTAFREGYAILIGEQVSCHAEIASVIASSQTQLGRRIRRRTAADHYRAERKSLQETRASLPREYRA